MCCKHFCCSCRKWLKDFSRFNKISLFSPFSSFGDIFIMVEELAFLKIIKCYFDLECIYLLKESWWIKNCTLRYYSTVHVYANSLKQCLSWIEEIWGDGGHLAGFSVSESRLNFGISDSDFYFVWFPCSEDSESLIWCTRAQSFTILRITKLLFNSASRYEIHNNNW